MDSNKLEFGIGEEYGLDFVEKEHSIKNSGDYDNTSMNGHTLTVNANRHGFDGVANDFRTYIGGESHCTACMSNDDFPNNLNFAVNGTFTITMPDGKKYSNTVAVAQGCNSKRRNNWWIGGKQMYGKAVNTPVAIGIFHRCDAAEDLKKKTDETISNIAQTVSEAIENVFNTIADNIKSSPDDFLKNVNTKVDEMAQNICDKIDNSSSIDANLTKKFVMDLANDIKKFIKELTEKSDMVQNFVIDIGNKVAEKIKEKITDATSAANQKLYEVIHEIIYAISLLFVRFDGSKSSPNNISMSIIGYQVIDDLKK